MENPDTQQALKNISQAKWPHITGLLHVLIPKKKKYSFCFLLPVSSHGDCAQHSMMGKKYSVAGKWMLQEILGARQWGNWRECC